MIFARRSIQIFIDKLSEKLPPDSVGKLVRSLNRNDRASLGFEWEIAVLYALNQLGEPGYETTHGGTVGFVVLGSYIGALYCHDTYFVCLQCSKV